MFYAEAVDKQNRDGELPPGGALYSKFSFDLYITSYLW